MQVRDPEALTRLGALAATSVWIDGQWWRVVSAGFLHASWLHLALNMLGLWSVGQWTELAWGPGRSTAIFLSSSVVGCLASLAWAEAPLVVGASAGIFGLAGALAAGRMTSLDAPAFRVISANALVAWLGFWLALGFLLPLLGVQFLAQAGHVGGLLAGTILGLGAGRRAEPVGWLALACSALGLTALAAHPAHRPNYHLFLGFELLERRAFAPAAESLEHALALSPGDPELSNAVAWALVEADLDLRRAESLAREALVADPNRADFLDTLGWALCKQGRWAEASQALEAASALDPAIPELQDHLSRCAGGPVPRGTSRSE